MIIEKIQDNKGWWRIRNTINANNSIFLKFDHDPTQAEVDIIVADLITMDYSFLGQPFVSGAAKSAIDLTTLDYAYLGQPFLGNPAAAGGGALLKILSETLNLSDANLRRLNQRRFIAENMQISDSNRRILAIRRLIS